MVVTDGAAGAGGPPRFATIMGAAAVCDACLAVAAPTPAPLREAAGQLGESAGAAALAERPPYSGPPSAVSIFAASVALREAAGRLGESAGAAALAERPPYSGPPSAVSILLASSLLRN